MVQRATVQDMTAVLESSCVLTGSVDVVANSCDTSGSTGVAEVGCFATEWHRQTCWQAAPRSLRAPKFNMLPAGPTGPTAAAMAMQLKIAQPQYPQLAPLGLSSFPFSACVESHRPATSSQAAGSTAYASLVHPELAPLGLTYLASSGAKPLR